MSRKEYHRWLLGTPTPEASLKKRTAAYERFCHTCGTKLVRRGAQNIVSTGTKTESKADFAWRHFCNAVCRAACKSARMATARAAL